MIGKNVTNSVSFHKRSITLLCGFRWYLSL